MRVAIFGKKVKDRDLAYIQSLFDVLSLKGIPAYVFKPYLEELKGKLKLEQEVGVFEGHLDLKVRGVNWFITLGGDGTILDAMTYIRHLGIPILGVNLGRLGFLATVDKKSIGWAISQLVKGSYRIGSRSMLKLESNLPVFEDVGFALNDFTILKRDTSSMINIKVYLDGSFLNSYWADGIIVSTPTGSTGYSLSCGGPIVFPESNNFIVTPVAPHNLNIRPIVISNQGTLAFEVDGRAENFLCTLDSRFESITAQHELAIRKNDFDARIIVLEDKNFINTLREKLTWGEDPRNK